MIPKLGKVQRVDVRSAWINEASHFTPWLASEEGMELLQETLDMELEVEATEKFVGPFKADILAKRTDTTDDHWVLIENQLERTDHRHLGQLLTYAAGLDAVTIVWIAESFAEEHRAALDWLNDVTGENLEFFGLEIELWQIAGSPPAPMFNVVAEPNEWSRNVQQGAQGEMSDLRQTQQRYWRALADFLAERQSSLRSRTPRPSHSTSFSIGKSGTRLSAAMHTQKKAIWVELILNGPGKVWFDALHQQKSAIEAELGQPLDWKRNDNHKRSRVVLYNRGIDPLDEQDWPKQQEWLAANLERFQKVLGPKIKALPNNEAGLDEDDDDGEVDG